MILSRTQKHTIAAGFMAWSLDAFDFFVLVFVLHALAKTFHVSLESVAVAVTITLITRPVGALLFGALADRYGRKPILILNVLAYSLLELASAFSSSLTIFLVLRALYGVAMGGVWGVSAALIMESAPEKSRGFISGLLQAGYPFGYLLASVVFGLFYNSIGWRGMFILGCVPIILVIYIYYCVQESPVWKTLHLQQAEKPKQWLKLWIENWKIVIFAILLMAAFNFMSHGTQDLYPTFLEVQHKFDTHLVSLISICGSVGAIIGSLCIGTLSTRFGKAAMIAAAVLLSLPVIPLWAFANSPFWLAVGAFLMQIFVQGAWGVVPVYLSQLSPDKIRGTLPGFTYQLGNLIASGNAVLQACIASQYNGSYSIALTVVSATAAIVISILVLSRAKFSQIKNY